MKACGKVTVRLLILAALSLLAACSDYDSASRSYQVGDYPQALLQFEKLAKAGDVHAQFDLAQMYNQGIGGDANPERNFVIGNPSLGELKCKIKRHRADQRGENS